MSVCTHFVQGEEVTMYECVRLYVCTHFAEGEEVTMQDCDQGRGEQQWHRWGQHIVCRRRPRLVLDIEGGRSRRGTKVLAFERNGEDNQMWTYEYRV